MKFYEALKLCVECGIRITREDWNGKNQYVYFTKGKKVPLSSWHGDEPTEEDRKKGYVEIKGHFDMKNAQGERIIGWLASQTDMVSDKWTWYVSPKKEELQALTRENYLAEDDDKDDHANRNWPNTD